MLPGIERHEPQHLALLERGHHALGVLVDPCGVLLAALLVHRGEALELHRRALGPEEARCRGGDARGFDVRAHGVVDRRHHLAREEAFPDETVEGELIPGEEARHAPRVVPDFGRADRFVRLLRAATRAIGRRLGGHVVPPNPRDDPLTRRLLGLPRDTDRVGPHVGDEPLGALRAEVDALVELLRDRHRLLGGEPEPAPGFLLERRGDERRRRVPAALAPRHRLHDPPHAFERRHHGARRLLVRERRLLARDFLERRHELRRAPAGEPRVQRPVLDRHERLDLPLPVHDQSHRDGLHAPRGKAALHLLPEQRRETVADEPIEDPAGLLRVDLAEVDLAGLGERGPDGALGDLVERDPVDALLVDVELLGEVPADRLPFPIRVGGDVERIDLLGCALQLVEDLLLAGRDDVFRLESLLRIHAELRLRQIAHVPHRGLDDVFRVQVLLDRLHLRGRFHHHQGPFGHYALLASAPTATHRCPGSCRAQPWSSSATSVAATRAGSSRPRAITCSMCCGSSCRSSASTLPSSLSAAGGAGPLAASEGLVTARLQGSGNSETMSCQQVTSLAPSWMSRFVPALASEVIRPGTANTSRPRSPAKPAVISAPLRSAASTTTTPSASAARVRLRTGKCPGSARVPGAHWETRAPRASMARASAWFSGGYTTSPPEPRTATVRPPAASAPRCAAVSMPRARPLTIVTPRAASAPASSSATATPYGVARRAPTIATA